MTFGPCATPGRGARAVASPAWMTARKARLRSCGPQRFLEQGDRRPGRLEFRGQEQDLRSTRLPPA